MNMDSPYPFLAYSINPGGILWWGYFKSWSSLSLIWCSTSLVCPISSKFFETTFLFCKKNYCFMLLFFSLIISIQIYSFGEWYITFLDFVHRHFCSVFSFNISKHFQLWSWHGVLMGQHRYSICGHSEDTHKNMLVLSCLIKSHYLLTHTYSARDTFWVLHYGCFHFSLSFLTNPENVTVWIGSIFTLL